MHHLMLELESTSIKITGAFEMLFASFANILLLQMTKILLRSRNPGHPLSIIAAAAYNSMLCLSVMF
ncbi:hypothetical protein LSUE1_G005969 [Lachnellula suecica]|uniref:Uncharacterized protein n=1 Tax=Lachnellula suecica TaxID=602035 RepID=A0A8T9CAB8_9HELO|nr:hypothetical protein LSUE1_G005969 [Lachnellula suecica]